VYADGFFHYLGYMIIKDVSGVGPTPSMSDRTSS
jgi:hypothetical protein